MYILGINAFHGDSSAALLKDGVLVAAAEEERFLRVKHWAGFPERSIRYCLAQGGITGRELDHVALSFNPRAHLWRKLLFAATRLPSPSSVLQRLRRQRQAFTLRSRLAAALGCSQDEIRARVHMVEHHHAHLAAAFFFSPFEEAALLSVDGMGDFVSTLCATGSGTSIVPGHHVYYPHSLGFLYNALTLYLGFPAYGDEYKVMGLAPYGQPEHLELFRRIVAPHGEGLRLDLEFFRHHKDGISMSWDGGAPRVLPFHSRRLEELLGPAVAPGQEIGRREENIAASLQRVTEEILFHLLARLHRRGSTDRLCIAGGVAMNSVAIGKITKETPFREVYVPVGAADNGTSFGAAAHVWHTVLGKPRSFVLEHAYWGPEHGKERCTAAAQASGFPYRVLTAAELVEAVAALLVEGKVVGWFQGRMELGARALGNRSLLADPRRADMRDIINLRIKFREKFRPFAPSVLREHVADYFTDDAPSPFMERVIPIRPEQQARIPAVTHVDGTGRLQTVERATNPLYHDLIQAFYRKTSVPLVLNTSLNENEPIVCTPEEAIDCFRRTAMDAIAVGPCLLTRVPSAG